LTVPVQVNEMHNADYGVAFRNVYKTSQKADTQNQTPLPDRDDE